MNKDLTIVIPCYNEAQSLPLLVEQIKGSNLMNDFLIVDNGSNDNTAEIIGELETASNIRFISKPTNNGYGAGIKFGISNAKSSLIGWMHGDLQQDIELLEKADFSPFTNQNKTKNLVALKGIRTKRSLVDCLFTICVSVVATVMFMRPCWDIAGQPNIFRAKDINFVYQAPDDHNFEFFVYIMLKLKGGKFFRFPAPFKKRVFGSSSWDIGILKAIKPDNCFLTIIISYDVMKSYCQQHMAQQSLT